MVRAEKEREREGARESEREVKNTVSKGMTDKVIQGLTSQSKECGFYAEWNGSHW